MHHFEKGFTKSACEKVFTISPFTLFAKDLESRLLFQAGILSFISWLTIEAMQQVKSLFFFLPSVIRYSGVYLAESVRALHALSYSHCTAVTPTRDWEGWSCFPWLSTSLPAAGFSSPKICWIFLKMRHSSQMIVQVIPPGPPLMLGDQSY